MSTSQAECPKNGVTLQEVIECESEIIARGRAVFDCKEAEPKFLFGLALSGGGIRSATFNLGLIQALAECRILARLDYLSTVSGGGYIGSWFSALLHRRAQRLAEASQSAQAPAAEQDATRHGSLLSWLARFFGKSRERQTAPPAASPEQLTAALTGIEHEIAANANGGRPEPRSLEWLRRYSNYLTPRFSLFSLDTLGAIANLFRNLVLNQVILVSLMVALLLVPLLLASAIEYWTASSPNLIAASPPLILTLLGIAAVATARGLRSLEMDGEQQLRRADVGFMVVLPVFLASLLVAAVVALTCTKPALEGQSLAWSGYGALVYPLIWGAAWRLASRSRALGGKHAPTSGQSRSPSINLASVIGFVLSPAGAGAALGLMLFGYANVVVKIHDDHALWLSISVGSMVVLQILCLAVGVQIGLGKRCFSEAAREWLGRAGGLVFAVEFGWAALALIAFYGPALVAWLNDWAVGGGAAWIGSTIAGLVLARSSKTGGARPVAWAEYFVRVVPYIFIVGLGIFLAGTIHWGTTSYAEIAPDCPRQTATRGEPGTCGAQPELAGVQGLFNVRFRDPGGDAKVYAINAKVADDVGGVAAYATATANEARKVPASLLAGALLVFLTLGSLFALRVDVNLFSMHQFYRNRLARCYLGASRRNGERHANAFTDLDPHDDIPLSYLADQRPIHLINAALNLTHVCDAEDAIRAHEPEAAVHLAWQQRLSSSFVFSPRFCGFAFPNDARRTRSFRPTAEFMVKEVLGRDKPGGADLGMAMAVSGAAANPNQGYHTAPALAFLMTFFNVRLGRWCGNPNSLAYEDSSPTFALWYLLMELIGHTDEKSDFLNLSDGGHFENLGLYELVRRRCKLIIASDASCDPKLEFEDLGNAIRKCRVDLGVEIKLDVTEMKAKKPEKRSRIAIGTIDYGAHGGGILIYLKPLRRGNESIDVRNYADTHKDFPHQATADQWFDEAQFESYRQLGLQSGRTLARNCGLVDKARRSARCDDWVAGVVATLKAKVNGESGSVP